MVVLFLQPKDFVLHFFALLILSLWAIEWALGGYRPQVDLGSVGAVRRWLGRNPRNWGLASASMFGAAVTLSTILSPLPAVSLWGRDFTQLGYELYSVLSLLVLFFAIALRVRDREQIRRVLLVFAGAGTVTGLYGISQRYGWDPIGNGEDQVRVISSFGNPIFFGSYLVMTTVITLGLALDSARSNARWWLPLIAVMLGVQLAAMWFTGSRGPWLGLVFGIGAFAVFGGISLSRSQASRAVTVFAAGLLIAFVVVNLPGTSSQAPGRGIGSILTGVTPAPGGLSGRSDIWEGSVRLLDSWEGQDAETGALSVLRPLLGLGPDMYYYSYPLVANPQRDTVVVNHAHNWPLQILFEYGVIGFASFLSLAILVFLLGASLIWDSRRGAERDDAWYLAPAIAITAALVGRAVEQGAGVARIGDLTPFWGLLGLALAIHATRHGSLTNVRSIGRQKIGYVSLGATVVVVLVAASIFAMRDIQMLRSGIIAADAFEEAGAGNLTVATEQLKRASNISPDVQQYGVWAGELLVEEARTKTDRESAFSLLGDAYNTFSKYQERDRLAFTTQLRIGVAEAELVNRGDRTNLESMVTRSLQTANSMPSYPAVQAFAAERVLIGGQLDLGLELADRAISMEAATSAQPFAWFMRGNALGDLGNVEEALEAFKASLERDPESPFAPAVHRNLALVYDGLGEPDLAAQHRSAADGIEASRAETAPGP